MTKPVRQLLTTIFLAFCSVFIMGCFTEGERRSESRIDTFEANNVLMEELAKQYELYLTGDASQARKSLIEETRLIEEAEWLPPKDKAHLLFVTCSRQYLLERSLKNDVAAEVAWMKVQYWLLRRAELSGLDPEASVKEVAAFTPERIIETFEAWDRRNNHEMPPSYKRQ